MSKIISIDETTFDDGSYVSYDGFVIKTDDGKEVKLGIDNCQNCCEDWGYIQSDDDLNQFIGSELLEVRVVDTALNNKVMSEEKGLYLDSGDIMFVNVETSDGTIQFAFYNSHNGYYGHEGVVIVDGIKVESEFL